MKLFDAHFHIIDKRFPLTKNQGYLPPNYTAKEYQEIAKRLNIKGGAIVSGSFQAFDQDYLIDALEALGPTFVGVTQLPHDTSDERLTQLDKKGVRAIRFNLKRGGSEKIEDLESFSRRVYEKFSWHAELYIDSKELHAISKTLLALPKVSIDHLGFSSAGTDELLKLVEKGMKVKATGFGRVDLNVIDTMKAIMNVNQNALMFGTDLPSTRAKRPFEESDIDLIKDNFEEAQVRKILFENGKEFYAR